MEIVILSVIQMMMTIYNITLFIISMKKMKDYEELKRKNEWQANKIKEFFEDKSWCRQSIKAKPTLTEDERVILRNIEFKDYIIIGRKESGDLYVNDKEKDSFNGTWFIMFKKHLFQFIKKRRRI